MAKKNSLFTDAFSFEEVLDDNYIISLSEKERKCISTNRSTAQKLAESPTFQKLKDDDGVDYFGIVLTKKYSLLMVETAVAQKKMSDQAFANMYELTAELMEQGYEESEIQGIISQPKNYNKLTEAQRAKAYKFLASAINNQGVDLGSITTLMKSRVTKSWNAEDTESLPESLSEKILAFLEGERSQWSNGDDEGKLEELSTGIEEKPEG
jgi:hypothetical protein